MDAQTLEKVTELLKAGDKAQAETVLKEVLRQNPRDDQAWVWVTQVLSTDKQRLECLDRALAINPQNAQALQYRQRLLSRLTTKGENAAGEPKPADTLPPSRPKPSPATPSTSPPRTTQPPISARTPPPTPSSPARPAEPAEPDLDAALKAALANFTDVSAEAHSASPIAPKPASPTASPATPPSSASKPSLLSRHKVSAVPQTFEPLDQLESIESIESPAASVSAEPPRMAVPLSAAKGSASGVSDSPPAASAFAPLTPKLAEQNLAEPPASPPERRLSNQTLIRILFGVFVTVLLAAASISFLVWSRWPSTAPAQPVVGTSTVAFLIPTLPPAWTATPSPPPTETATPRPSATFTPVATALFTGALLTYQNSDGSHFDIYQTDGSGAGLNLTGEQFVNGNPAWSSSGEQMAFDSQRDSAAPDIYAMDADGTNVRQLTTDPATDVQPAWGPDGNRLVFVSNRNGNNDLYLMNADGSDQVPLTDSPEVNESDPAWSPDGQRIVFTSSTCEISEETEVCHNEISIINVDGLGLTQLTQGGRLGSAEPAWSPDGQQIVFASDVLQEGEAPRQLILMNADGSDLRPLVIDQLGEPSEPDWSPDGDQIAFVVAPEASGVNRTSILIVPAHCFTEANSCTLEDLLRLRIDDQASNPAWRSNT